jgi:ATP-dependent RNA helicase DDX54/DBP10
MARTGSGKTLAYLIPLIQSLRSHSPVFGARGLIVVPTRELVGQVLKVGKEMSRGWKGEGEVGGEGLRWASVTGGEGMEAQFEQVLGGNPDV